MIGVGWFKERYEFNYGKEEKERERSTKDTDRGSCAMTTHCRHSDVPAMATENQLDVRICVAEEMRRRYSLIFIGDRVQHLRTLNVVVLN